MSIDLWHGAAKNGYEAVMKLLIDENTALLGHEPVMKLLIEKDAAVNPKDRYGELSLFLAEKGHHEAVVKRVHCHTR
jgi:ankyrin repeat protein